MIALVAGAGLSLLSWSVDDPSLTHATAATAHNWLGKTGAIAADLMMQFLGVGAAAALAPPAAWGWRLVAERRIGRVSPRILLLMAGAASTSGFASLLPPPASWPLPSGLGGVVGDAALWLPRKVLAGNSTRHDRPRRRAGRDGDSHAHRVGRLRLRVAAQRARRSRPKRAVARRSISRTRTATASPVSRWFRSAR